MNQVVGESEGRIVFRPSGKTVGATGENFFAVDDALPCHAWEMREDAPSRVTVVHAPWRRKPSPRAQHGTRHGNLRGWAVASARGAATGTRFAILHDFEEQLLQGGGGVFNSFHHAAMPGDHRANFFFGFVA